MYKFKRNWSVMHQAGAWLLIAGLLIGCAPITTPATSPLATPRESVATPADDASTPDPNAPTSAPVETSTPTSPVISVTVTPEAEDEIPDRDAPHAETGAAVVENIDIRILESFPVQIHAVLSGYLPDGCTTIAGTEVIQEGTTFRIRMATRRPANAMCTMVITPFEEVVPLDVSGLPAGTYQVAVNALQAEFELPESGVENPPEQ